MIPKFKYFLLAISVVITILVLSWLLLKPQAYIKSVDSSLGDTLVKYYKKFDEYTLKGSSEILSNNKREYPYVAIYSVKNKIIGFIAYWDFNYHLIRKINYNNNNIPFSIITFDGGEGKSIIYYFPNKKYDIYFQLFDGKPSLSHILVEENNRSKLYVFKDFGLIDYDVFIMASNIDSIINLNKSNVQKIIEDEKIFFEKKVRIKVWESKKENNYMKQLISEDDYDMDGISFFWWSYFAHAQSTEK